MKKFLVEIPDGLIVGTETVSKSPKYDEEEIGRINAETIREILRECNSWVIEGIVPHGLTALEEVERVEVLKEKIIVRRIKD